ncbi:MAG TPA: YceI family protein, partial [Acidimicrobiaceae bacterium]|nr:YceI family protein [Acidimicrobiaceae bacterium]
MQQHWKKIVIGLVAVTVLGVGAVYAYLLWFKEDAPPALDSSDLDDALGGDTTVPSADGGTTLPADTTVAPINGEGVDGVWTIAQADTTVGYRVQEVLGGVDTEGAGRTNQVTGSLTLAGTQATAGEFTVDMASVTSDSDRRDGQFRDRIMSVDEFPTATFVLTAPIEFGAIPAEGESITATATGDLTLHGTTLSVTFEVEARLENGRIGVLGSIPILFSDYGIPDPSNSFATVKDNGLLEFVLV